MNHGYIGEYVERNPKIEVDVRDYVMDRMATLTFTSEADLRQFRADAHGGGVRILRVRRS